MLTSITPLGERGRGNRYGLTVGAYLAGSAAGGAATGAVLGLLGSATAGRLALDSRLLLAAGLCLAAVALDLRPTGWARGWRRQVNEDWLTQYRGWVYGVGFGAQLGAGVVTIVTSAVTWAFLAVVVLVASPTAGLLAGTAFGLVRAMPVLALRRVHDPAALRAAAGRLEALGLRTARATSAWLALSAAVLAAGAVVA